MFDVLNMVRGLGIISSVLGTGVDLFLNSIFDIWNINKENAQIKADYINMVNRVRRE
jgi:hypothetical protein